MWWYNYIDISICFLLVNSNYHHKYSVHEHYGVCDLRVPCVYLVITFSITRVCHRIVYVCSQVSRMTCIYNIIPLPRWIYRNKYIFTHNTVSFKKISISITQKRHKIATRKFTTVPTAAVCRPIFMVTLCVWRHCIWHH